MHRIIAISNRVPALDNPDACSGGLAVGLKAALDEAGGLWLGWSGRIAQPADDKPNIQPGEAFTLATFDLTEAEHSGYYLGFANRILWPLLHGQSDLARLDVAELGTYLAVARKFARHAAPLIDRNDVVWVHDYHLMPVGQHLRWLGVASPLGFFLHTPFPTADVLSALPCHRDLIRCLAAYDVIGFQTAADVTNFRNYAARELGAGMAGDDHVSLAGRKIRVGAFPIGIDVGRFAELGAAADGLEAGRHIASALNGRLGIVGADRLDYTKGIAQRLLGYERLLKIEPGYRGRTSLVQIAAPSREAIPEYQRLKGELESLSGRINGRYGELGWTPVQYFNRSFGHAALAALYRASPIGLVTPLRDGMNLVAKEYVAAQDPADPGVLVLSKFAGAAAQLKSAVVVDPHDIDGIAGALKTALCMPLDERRARWTEAMAGLRKDDIHAWCHSFLRALSQAKSGANDPVLSRPRRAARSDRAAVEQAGIAMH